MRPVRIAYILNVFPKLSETFISNELAELRRQEVELRICSLRRPEDTLRHELVAQAGLDRLACYEPGEFPEWLRQFQPQLLHAHFATEPAAAARELAATLGIPFTFTAHGYDIRRKPPPDFAQRAAAAACVITVSEANAACIEQNFGVPRGRIRVIPCGVDLKKFCPAERISGEPPLVVCVARHVKVKNLGLLLEACALLRGRGAAFRCVLVGDGPLRPELEALRSKLGLETVVEMPGAAEQSQVRQWWQQAAVAVLTSENEGMPVCLMEAAACGVPAVAPAVGGIPELVQDGVTGLLSAPGDSRACAEALERLLKNPALRARMGLAARQRAQACFCLETQVQQLLALWTEVLNHG